MTIGENNQKLHQHNTRKVECADFVAECGIGITNISPGFKIEKLVCPPMELETAPIQNHCVAFLLSSCSHQFHRFDGKEYYGVANVGDFNLLPAGLSGSWSWTTTNTGLLLNISQGFLDRIVSTSDCQNANRLELRSIPLDSDRQMKALANFFLAEVESNYLGGSLATEALKNLFGINLLRHYCSTTPIIRTYECGLSKHNLDRVIEYIESHLNRDLSLAKMSELTNLSEYYFCRMFKASTGVSPHQYVIKMRIERAKLLIQQRNIPLADIALQVGFANQSHFNRHFKRMIGVTPRQFQNQC